MTWDDFLSRYSDWSEATLKSRISKLEDMGSGEELVLVVQSLFDDKCQAQLVRKAMRLGVQLTREDYENLYGALPDALYEEVGAYGGFAAAESWSDEEEPSEEPLSAGALKSGRRKTSVGRAVCWAL